MLTYHRLYAKGQEKKIFVRGYCSSSKPFIDIQYFGKSITDTRLKNVQYKFGVVAMNYGTFRTDCFSRVIIYLWLIYFMFLSCCCCFFHCY